MKQADFSSAKQFLQEWQGQLIMADLDLSDPRDSRTVQAKVTPRKQLLQQGLRNDTRKWPRSVAEMDPKYRPTKTAETFTKIPGSNPRQIREQFLKHVSNSGREYPKPSTKLRPTKDVLNRLRYDAAYNLDDYVIGYIDRHAGIMEKSAALWVSETTEEEWVPEDRIAYFKHVPEDLVVWDRAKKIDWIFNSKPR